MILLTALIAIPVGGFFLAALLWDEPYIQRNK